MYISAGFLSYMLGEKKKHKYLFESDEESTSSTSTSKSQSPWQRKLQKMKEKGPAALDDFRNREKERLYMRPWHCVGHCAVWFNIVREVVRLFRVDPLVFACVLHLLVYLCLFVSVLT